MANEIRLHLTGGPTITASRGTKTISLRGGAQENADLLGAQGGSVNVQISTAGGSVADLLDPETDYDVVLVPREPAGPE